MKIVTIISKHYIDIAYNLYLQLSEFSMNKELIIYVTDNNTYEQLLSKQLDCTILLYKSKWNYLKFIPNSQDDKSKLMIESGLNRRKISVAKFDAVIQCLDSYKENILLLDSDHAIFDNFISELEILINNKQKGGRADQKNTVAIKLYSNLCINTDNNISIDNVTNIEYTNEIKPTVNAGFVYFSYSHESYEILYYILYTTYKYLYDQKCPPNIDEHLLYNYLTKNHVPYSIIPDQINMLNNMTDWYPPEQIISVYKCKTFHVLFVPDKIQYLRWLNRWLVEK